MVRFKKVPGSQKRTEYRGIVTGFLPDDRVQVYWTPAFPDFLQGFTQTGDRMSSLEVISPRPICNLPPGKEENR
jgi:hypothetical protein